MVVSVVDLNDNSPQFSSATYSTTHDEDNGSGLVVGVVTANDVDEGSNGEVEYRITGGNSDSVFSIDPNSVSVTVRGSGCINYICIWTTACIILCQCGVSSSLHSKACPLCMCIAAHKIYMHPSC